MDLNSFKTNEAHDEGAELNVRDQFGVLTDLFITVVGVDSKIWRGIDADRNRKIVQRMITKEPAGDIADDNFENLAKASVAWRGATLDGKPVKFSYKAVLALYKSAPYIADQVDRFIGQRKNFIKG